MVYFTLGLFLNVTEILFCISQGIQMFNNHTIYRQSLSNPLQNNKEPHTYLEGQLLTRGDKFPSTLAPSLVTTAPPFSFHPFHPFHSFPTPQPTLHCLQRRHQQSRSSLSETPTYEISSSELGLDINLLYRPTYPSLDVQASIFQSVCEVTDIVACIFRPTYLLVRTRKEVF